MTRKGMTIRVGLIGYGYAGQTFHAPLIHCAPGLELSVVGSSKHEAVAEKYPTALVCAPAEVPTHPGVDLVVIATPNDSHYPLAAAALRAGKDVVLDKPFTVTLAEARSLAEIAAQRNRLLSVFHNRRWESEILATKAILEAGTLGEISHYESHIDRFRPVVRQRWREDPGPGAGLWFDLGPHLIDQALYLFGLPHSVNATFGILRKGGSTDDWAHVQLIYDDMRAILHASLLVSGGGPRSVLHGTLGSWAKFGADVQEQQLKDGMLPTDPAFGHDPSPCFLYDGATGSRTEVPSPVGNQLGYYTAIRDAILGNGPIPVPARDAIACMAILETSFASGARGQTLPIPLTGDERALWQAN
ncbi:MAG TPA: oxidoreductase [Acidobacteriaceae bacterium]|nr:oxidoreductase [Acidobacteriaceae bacterium]